MRYAWLAEYISPTATAEEAADFARYLMDCGWYVPPTLPLTGDKAIVNAAAESITYPEMYEALNSWERTR
jgi:hypothetical protein